MPYLSGFYFISFFSADTDEVKCKLKYRRP